LPQYTCANTCAKDNQTNMLPILGFLALFLPSSTLATPLLIRDHSWNSTKSSLPILADEIRHNQHGDTFGITRCYCASKHWQHNDLFGYYYLWDYYNFHTDQRFLLERTCHRLGWTRGGPYGSMNVELMCLRFKNGERECMKDPAGNKFCYYMFGKEKFDHFTYNGQMRGVPFRSKVAIHDSEAQVTQKCEALCHDKVGDGDMEMLRGRSLLYVNGLAPIRDRMNVRDEEWSHIAFYPEVDDMCQGCR